MIHHQRLNASDRLETYKATRKDRNHSDSVISDTRENEEIEIVCLNSPSVPMSASAGRSLVTAAADVRQADQDVYLPTAKPLRWSGLKRNKTWADRRYGMDAVQVAGQVSP